MGNRHNSIELANNGIACCDIVLPSSPTPAEEYAAEELRSHLARMIGHSPKIYLRHENNGSKIIINDAEMNISTLSPEEFHIETRNGDVYLSGGDSRGTLYAVYHLLESLGCRWYAPNVEHIPMKPNITMPDTNITQSPAFEYRDNYNSDTADPAWRVRNRLHSMQINIPEYMGGQIKYGMFCHTFFSLLPIDEFFPSHPEYFSMLDGMRRRDANQLCVTNPGVVRIATTRLLEKIKENPRATIFSLSQNDGPGWCQCPQCTAIAEYEESQMGPILHFVNAVADEVARVYPDKIIDTIAYQHTLDAPRHVRPRSNVRVRVCPIACCQAHSYGTCDHAESKRAYSALQNWTAISDNIYVWHYSTNFSHYLLPMPNLKEFTESIRIFHKNGVKGIFLQGAGDEGGGAELMALRGYLAAKLLWNPMVDDKKIIHDFCLAYYGAGSASALKYIKVFQDIVDKDRTLHPSLGENPNSKLFAKPNLAKAEKVLAPGLKAASGKDHIRLNLLQCGINYARLNQNSGIYKDYGYEYKGTATDEDRTRLNIFEQGITAAGVQYLSEGNRKENRLNLLRNRLSIHVISSLKDQHQQVSVVPALGGRILNYRTDEYNWLAAATPDSFDYPYPDGYLEYAGYITGSLENYSCQMTENVMTLESLQDNGLRMRRKVSLSNNALHVYSELKNISNDKITTSWGARWVLNIQDADAALNFNTAEDNMKLPLTEMSEGFGSHIFEQQRMPIGNTVNISTGKYVIKHTIRGDVFRFATGKEENRHALSLYYCTNTLNFEIGEKVIFKQTLSVEKV